MMKIKAALALLAVSCSTSFASIAVDFTAVGLQDSGGVGIPVGSLVLLVGDTGADGFGDFTLSNNSSLTVGSSFGSDVDDLILVVSGSPDESIGAFSWNFTYGVTTPTSLLAGDSLILVWFPDVSVGATTPGDNQEFGTFRTDLLIDGSNLAWVAPPDNTTAGTINSFNNQLATQTTVPEPSTTFLALAAGGFLFLRRKRL